jgi:hypothetical protein
VTAIVARATWATRTAFESRAGRTATAIAATIWAAIGTTSTAVWTTTAAAITSATLRALETCAGIAAADAGGIAREIFAGSSSATDARSARLAGKQDDIFLDDGWSCGDFARMRFDYFRLGVFVFGTLVLSMFMFRVFSVLVNGVLGLTESGSVFGAFVCGVGFEFCTICGTVLFDFFGFVLGEFGFRGGLIFCGVQMRFFLAFFLFGFFLREFRNASCVNFLGFILFEIGATCESIDLCVIGSLFVFSLGQLESQGGGLPFTQLGFSAERLGRA